MMHSMQAGYLTSEQLVTWLHHKGYYEAFLEALHSPTDTYHHAYDAVAERYAIHDALRWGQTPQGSGFWGAVHSEYCAYVRDCDDDPSKRIPPTVPNAGWFLEEGV